jgi:2-pyrone-4,6-dicarboxylate lactonase
MNALSIATGHRSLGSPKWKLPENTCDCHAHVFGPYDRFALAHTMHYAAPVAPAALHREMLHRAGLSRGVLIQPGAFGVDPANIVDALQLARGRLRGIGAATATVTEIELDAWHEAGIKGLRFNEMLSPAGSGRFPGAVGTEDLVTLAPRLAARGWHAEIWASIDQHVALLPTYRASGLPVVLDHMAGIATSRGVDDPNFQLILSALGEGWLWIKLTLCRASAAFPDYADLQVFHDALVGANSERLVWGSDWPHLRLADKTPDVGRLLDLFHQWTPDETVRRRILVSGPAELYGFEPDTSLGAPAHLTTSFVR